MRTISFGHLFIVHKVVRRDCQHSACCCYDCQLMDWLIDYFFAVCFGNIWNTLVSDFNLLRLTWLAICLSEKQKTSKAIWRNISQAVSFRGQNSGSPKLSTNGKVFWCVLYFLHPKLAQKENRKIEATKIGINGFGRIGRMVFQAGLSQQIGFPPLVLPVIWDCQILPGHLRPEPLGNQVGRGGCGWYVHWCGIFCVSNEAACLQWMRVVLPVVSTECRMLCDKMEFPSMAVRIVWRLECVWISFFVKSLRFKKGTTPWYHPWELSIMND